MIMVAGNLITFDLDGSNVSAETVLTTSTNFSA